MVGRLAVKKRYSIGPSTLPFGTSSCSNQLSWNGYDWKTFSKCSENVCALLKSVRAHVPLGC